MSSKNKSKDIILIVDDIEINRTILREMLQSDYEIVEAGGGKQALNIIFGDNGTDIKTLPTAILLDIMMPDMDGFQVLKKVKSIEATKNIPVLFITAADSEEIESRGLIAGAADYITKPFNMDVVKARINNHVSLAQYRHKLEHLVEVKTAEVTRTYESTLEVLATIIEYRNLESGAHIRRTMYFTDILIEKMKKDKRFNTLLSEENIGALIKASALHDIGKIGIPDDILLKPGKLTVEEFEVIKTHTTIGGRIIDSIAKNLPDNDLYMKYARDICLYHHERWDGNGYPTKLSGTDIPLCARIISVVDVYDALTSIRCYKSAFSHEESLGIILEGKGTQFDPDIVDIVMEIADIFKDIESTYRDM